MGRAQGGQAGRRVTVETPARSIPGAPSRRSHLGQALARGCLGTPNRRGLVQARRLLGGFAREAWAMASAVFAGLSAIALNSQSHFPP